MRATLQVWCLAVSSSGDFVITGSHDRCARLMQLCVGLKPLQLQSLCSRPRLVPVCRAGGIVNENACSTAQVAAAMGAH